MDPIKVVVRYRDGKTIKGYTQNFFPNKPTFFVQPHNSKNTDDKIDVSVKELKAIFFVRDFHGNAKYIERRKVATGDRPQGRFIEVTCKDNEVLVGSTAGYDPQRAGFFMFFVDSQGNNIKAYIVADAVARVRYL